MVQLYNSGKPRSEILKEYDLTPSAFDKWVSRINTTGSAKEADNRTPEEMELMKLRKENQRLKMEEPFGGFIPIFCSKTHIDISVFTETVVCIQFKEPFMRSLL